MVACATVVYTAPPPPVPAASATKSCTLTSTANVYTCLYTVTPAFPAASAPPSPNGDYIHVNEPPGPPMTGPGTFIGTPTVVSVSGCGSTALPVTSTSSTSYNAWMGVGGCAGTAWSVTFSETVAVTADGQICQSFWMVAAVDPVTACATVAFTKSLPTGDGKFTTAPNFGTGAVAQVVFGGGTVDDLEVSMVGAGATGVWVQDSTGAFQLLIANGPAFLKDAFALKFPGGFATVVGVTLVR